MAEKCKVCGCTDDCACVGGCYWVAVEFKSKPLCSACSGGLGDLTESARRAQKALRKNDPRLAMDVLAAVLVRRLARSEGRPAKPRLLVL